MDISNEETVRMLEENGANNDFIVLDLRTAVEYAAGALPRAVNIDYYGEDFASRIAGLDADKTYMIYCRSGVRSKNALSVFAGAGILNIYHVKNGYIGYCQYIKDNS